MHTQTKPEEQCGFMILTPSPLHNGGMWCAESYPCKTHGKWKENKPTSTTTATPPTLPGEDWEQGFDKLTAGTFNHFIREFPSATPALVRNIKKFIKSEITLAKQQERTIFFEQVAELSERREFGTILIRKFVDKIADIFLLSYQPKSNA